MCYCFCACHCHDKAIVHTDGCCTCHPGDNLIICVCVLSRYDMSVVHMDCLLCLSLRRQVDDVRLCFCTCHWYENLITHGWAVVFVTYVTSSLCVFVFLHLSLVRQVDCAYRLFVVLVTQMTRLLCAFMLCTCHCYDKLIVHMDWLLYLSFM